VVRTLGREKAGGGKGGRTGRKDSKNQDKMPLIFRDNGKWENRKTCSIS